MGYAIGHYARWLKRGAVRLDVLSDDPLLKVTAFRDTANKRVVLIMINNAKEERSLQVTFSNFGVCGEIVGEQSRAHIRWEPLKPVAVISDNMIQSRLPGLSVTTYALNLKVKK